MSDTIYNQDDDGRQLQAIETAVGIHRCRYCEGRPVMVEVQRCVWECPECCYEEVRQ